MPEASTGSDDGIRPKRVDRAEVTIVMDNFVDVLVAGSEDVHSLEGLFARYGRRRLPLVIHPEAWRERKVVFPTGAEIRLPPPNRADLEAEGLELVEERGQTLLLDDGILVARSTA
jgi:hypothetical protein